MEQALRVLVVRVLLSFWLVLPSAFLFPQINSLQHPDDIHWSNLFAVSGLNQYQSLLPTSPGRICMVRQAGYFVLPNANGTFDNYLLASWDGTGWNIEGPGEYNLNEVVNAIEVIGTDTYIGGNFTRIGTDAIPYVARWDGSRWWPLGGGVNGQVRALATDGNLRLYLGGDFTLAGGTQASKVVQWDGDSWVTLTNTGTISQGVNGNVWDIAVGNSAVYVAGEFSHAAGLFSPYVAKWNWTNTSWSNFGVGPGAVTTQIDVSDISSKVFVSGGYYANFAPPYILQWDGNSWSTVGSGSSTLVTVLEALNNGGAVANGHYFGDGSTAQLGVWDGASQWDSLAGLTEVAINSIASKSYDDIYVAITSSNTPDFIHNGIAHWNGKSWTGMGEGIGGFWSFAPEGVYALAQYNNEIYAGGIFTSAGSKPINALARWDGSRWNNVGGSVFSPPNDKVMTLKVIGSDLYVGGNFSSVGGVPALCIARWDGNAWHALGGGISGHAFPGGVRTIEMIGSDLYAGGAFNFASGVKSHGISKWNGSAWSSLGGGIDGDSRALATDGTNLYVGGGFVTLEGGTLTASCVARWNGTSWSALGTGMGGSLITVNALAYSEGTLYAGGKFTTAGGVAARNIARWNGTAWDSLGAGLPGPVYAIWVNGSELFAGGQFSGDSANPIYGVAKWNGSSWVSLGIGVHKNINFPATPTVYSLLGTSDGLYLGGDFTHAGNKYSNQIALWKNFIPTGVEDESQNTPMNFRLEQNYPNPFNPETEIRFTVLVSSFTSLKVYDVLGREVATLVNERKPVGTYRVRWDAGNQPGGIYFCKLQAGSFAETKKMLLIK